MEQSFSLTDSASAQILRIREKEGNRALRFRVTVKGGGCSGFQYDFSLDGGDPAEGDTVIGNNGAEVIIDDVSLGILKGSMLDYSEDLAAAGFSIKNPNATAKCGCGNSFSVNL